MLMKMIKIDGAGGNDADDRINMSINIDRVISICNVSTTLPRITIGYISVSDVY